MENTALIKADFPDPTGPETSRFGLCSGLIFLMFSMISCSYFLKKTS
jgi:hypothetical protein